jgi:hypothetical protein
MHSFTATGSASWSVSSGLSAWRTRAWRRPRPSSCLSRFWIDMCITLTRRTSRYVTPLTQTGWLRGQALILSATGHDQVPQWPDRAHPRQPGGEPAGIGVGGGESKALFADARDDQGQGVRGYCFDAKVRDAGSGVVRCVSSRAVVPRASYGRRRPAAAG